MVANECGRVQRKAVETTRDHNRATPDVCGSSVWDLFYIVLLEPRSLRWLLFEKKKICAILVANHFIQLPPWGYWWKPRKASVILDARGQTLQLSPQCCQWRLSATEPQRYVRGRRDLLAIRSYGQPGWDFSWHSSVPSGRCLVSAAKDSFLIPSSSLLINHPASWRYAYSVLLTISLSTRETKEQIKQNKQTNKIVNF